MKIKAALASYLVIAFGVILAVHFTLLWMHGGVFIYESNKTVLLIESIMSFAIVGFGIERLINAAFSRRR